VSHAALSVSRVLYHAAVFWLIFDLWHFQEVAYADHREFAALLLPIALAVNAALVLGLWTRVLLIANAILLRVVFGLCLDGYTVDEVVENTSLVLAFGPAPQALSLDTLRDGSHDLRAPLPTTFVLLVFASLALLYGDGLRYKFASQVWREGSAFWLGATLPHFSTGLLPQWAKMGWLMRTCTWGALAYETLFPLILVRRFRPVLATLGIALHAGTGLFMALPQFALLMTGLVVLFLPWDARLARAAPPPQPGGGAPPWRLARVASVLVALMVGGQLSLNLAPSRPRNVLCRVLGLHQRAIFIDWHFLLPGPLLRFTVADPQGETVIPSFDENGYPMLHDRYWKLFGFTLRAPGADVREPTLRYVRGWLERSGRKAADVRVYCRDVRLRTLALDFEADDEQRRRPWILCGTISFRPADGRAAP
jgi:hypothetical protein